MNSNQAYQAAQHGFDPYAAHPDTGGFFSSISHAVSKAAKAAGHVATRGVHDLTHPKDFAKDTVSTTKLAYKGVIKPVVNKALPVVMTVLKNTGPIGMVASGALGAMRAGLNGQNLESIAWAAAEGAAPSGIDKAIQAAEALRHGKSVVSVALSTGRSYLTQGSPEKLGYDAAIKTLQQSASKAALGVARRALPTEGARRAFDMAIGTVAQAASGGGSLSSLTSRAMSIPNIAVSAIRAPITAGNPQIMHVMRAFKTNPGLMTQHPSVLAKQFGTHVSAINDALLRSSKQIMLPWRSMSAHAVSFVRRYAPNAPIMALRHAHTDTGGLDQTGMKYIVEKGDGPWAIAQKLTGNGNRWTELKALNTDKNPTIDKNVWVGEVLNLPASWQKPVAVASLPTSALPSAPLPTIAPIPGITTPVLPTPSIDLSPSIIQGKSILVAWANTDGVNQAGVPGYGANAADLSTTMGPRDTLELASFQNWNNKTIGSNLNTAGSLDPSTLTALQQWAEARATAALPASPATPVVSLPQVIPAVVIGGTAPPAPPPGVPALPSGASPLPTVAPANQPTTPAKVAAQSSGSSLGMIGAGAVIGGLLFGVPGALIGAAGGAAVS